MALPVWTTTAGILGTFNEEDSSTFQLNATNATSFSLIAGSLPTGMKLSSSGLLEGVPAQVEKRTRYTFVVRATDGNLITDRTFALDIEGQDAPVFTTSSGQLELDDSTRVGLFWVLDGEPVSHQIVATDVDTRSGRSLEYSLYSGILPPGLTLSSSGLLAGTVKLTDDYVSSDSTTSLVMTFDIVIRVSDGTTATTQSNSIFVVSADYFKIDNDKITVDQTQLSGAPLTMDVTAQRRPIFLTDSDLGTFRHENNVVVKIDIEDLDSTGSAFVYSIQSGSLPTGLSIDSTSGEIFGTLPRQNVVEADFTFTIRATRTIESGVTVFTDKNFTMKVIGDIDIGINFTTESDLGTLTAGIPSLLSVRAETEEANRVLSYSVTDGNLPTGITLSEQGNLVGTIDINDFDDDSTRSFSFTVTVSDQYQTSAAKKLFTVNISLPFTTIQYGNFDGHATSFIDQNIFYQIAQDPNINSPELIYRQEDPSFGIKLKPEMLIASGIEAQTLTTFQNKMEDNHAPITLFFGDLKTAVAKENGVTKYEVVYLDIVDKFENNEGLPTGNTTMRPNAVENMRTSIKSLGHKEWTYLPLWMKTPQSDPAVNLGYIKAVPICFCKPGESGRLKKRIEDLNIDFKKIQFIIDRYKVSNAKIVGNTFTGDGSSVDIFELNEIIHEEDIVVKQNGVIKTLDTDFHLTHNTTTQKTNIVFTSAPADGDIIKVSRANDKYLKFKDV